MAYIEEKFKSRLERNERKDELKKTHAGVVIWSNPIKIRLGNGLNPEVELYQWETEWVVAYLPELIETEEQLAEVIGNEGTTEQEHQTTEGVSEVLPSAS